MFDRNQNVRISVNILDILYGRPNTDDCHAMYFEKCNKVLYYLFIG